MPGTSRNEAEPYIERVIREATERGELTPTVGVGAPIRGLDRDDPGWWVRSWFERDRETSASAELLRRITHGVAAALHEDDEGCIRIVSALNEEISRHNRGVGEDDRLPLLDLDRIRSRRGRVPPSGMDTRDPGPGGP